VTKHLRGFPALVLSGLLALLAVACGGGGGGASGAGNRPSSAPSIAVLWFQSEPLGSRGCLCDYQVWRNGTASPLLARSGFPGDVNWAAGMAVSGMDEYIVGEALQAGTVGTGAVATIWKNGVVAASLFDGTRAAVANAVTVSGSDVYVAGFAYNDGTVVPWDGTYGIATVWKNGVASSLTDGSRWARATSIAVAGDDVYVAGTEANIAKVWKNGVATSLTDGSRDAWVSALVVAGDDVYVAGTEETAAGVPVAKVWKNGVAISLTDGAHRALASSIAVVGSDIYVAGTEYGTTWPVAKMWKNGVATSLTDGSQSAEAVSIAVLGGGVYVAGSDGNVVKLWKNGVATSLSDGTKETVQVRAMVVH
jgi:hypothetical protein